MREHALVNSGCSDCNFEGICFDYCTKASLLARTPSLHCRILHLSLPVDPRSSDLDDSPSLYPKSGYLALFTSGVLKWNPQQLEPFLSVVRESVPGGNGFLESRCCSSLDSIKKFNRSLYFCFITYRKPLNVLRPRSSLLTTE